MNRMIICFLLVLPLIVNCGTSSSASLTMTGSISATAAVAKQFNKNVMLPFDSVFSALPQAAAGNVSSVTFRIRSMYVSTATDCSNPVLVADHGTTGTDFNMAASPTILTGSPPNGTYVCVALGMDDIITWAPDATAQATNAGCNPAVSETFDIYRTNSGDSPNWKTYNGTGITATGTGAGALVGRDPIFIFASTNASQLAAGAIAPHTNQTVTLSSALTVPGSAVFYSSFAGQVAGNATTCDLNGVTFGFR